MRGGDIAGLLIRQARLQRDWSQEGLCRGICAPSYLSKIEQGKAAPSPEVTELLLHRLGLVWTPEPEGLAPCWKALLSGSPNFDSLYEQLVQPRREILASSPLAADAGAGALSAGAPGLPPRRYLRHPTSGLLPASARHISYGLHPLPPAVGAGVVQGQPSVPSSLPPVGGVSCKIAFLPY